LEIEMYGTGVVSNGMMLIPSLMSQHTVSKDEIESGHVHACARTNAQSTVTL
jgi:hypothetical protein